MKPNELTRYLLRLEFNGDNFLGWQFQNPHPLNTSGREPLQNVIERAILRVLHLKERHNVQGCGRTDTGVHAEEFYAHVDLDPRSVEAIGGAEKFRHRLNCVLPDAVGATHLQEVSQNFHALKSKNSKTYEYRVLVRRTKPVLELSRALWIPMEFAELDIPAMQQGLKMMEGVHDFLAFASSGFTAFHTERELYACKLETSSLFENPSAGTLLRLSFTGSGFLKQMVRNLSGTLLEIGQKKRSLENLAKLLDPLKWKLSRKDAGFCAEAHGLILKRVEYGPMPDSAAQVFERRQ